MAQLVEQLTRNEQVTGSNPVVGSTNASRLEKSGLFLYLPTVVRIRTHSGENALR